VGQPNSDTTILFLQALLTIAQQKAKRVLVVIWDQASWHKSHRLKHWVHQHNQQARQQDGVRLLTCLLPSKSPWLNPMEPIWLHTKRKVAEPDGDLSVQVLKQRLCAQFHTTLDAATLKPSD
jgi:transposase